MALRNLVTKMRTPAAAAFRFPSAPRVSPPAGSRALASSNSSKPKGLNAPDPELEFALDKKDLESASYEVLKSKADILTERAFQVYETLSDAHEQSGALLVDACRLLLKYAFTGILLSFTNVLIEVYPSVSNAVELEE